MSTHYPFQPTPLPFSYTALVPHCDPDTIYVHYDKIYLRDVQLLNQLLARYPAYQTWTLDQLITGKMNLPTVVETNIRHYAGSIYTHNLYFSTLCANAAPPSGKLGAQIANTYGSLSGFQTFFKQAAHNILGAGWVWLIAEQDGSLHIIITQNYEIPTISNSVSVFALDVWEHAFFLPYPANLSGYIDNWFSVLNWRVAENNYQTISQLPPTAL